MQINSSYNALPTSLTNGEATKEIAKQRTENRQSELNIASSEVSSERTTYGLDILENMADEEYDAFLRATRGMDSTKVERSAQTLQLIAAAYQNTQNLITSGLASTLNGEEFPSLMNDLKSLDVRKAIDEGISVLKQMSENDQRQSVRLLERMAMALTQSGLNIHG